jgi:hypothetical protein
MKKSLCVLVLAGAGALAQLACSAPGHDHTNGSPKGFEIAQIGFGLGARDQTAIPQIPKSWRLISVCSIHEFESRLWFQDPDGAIYEVTVDFTSDKTVVRPVIHKLNRG